MAKLLNQLKPDWAWQPFQPTDDRPWTRSLAAHLYRRAGFSASTDELERAARLPPAEIVEQLAAGDDAADAFADRMDAFGETILASGDPRSLSAWWLYRMLHSPRPLVEKMTLFWHGHFATGADKVNSARLMLDQHELLRKHALGDFRALVHGISRDPAMLIYLDSQTNRKTHPNENYAREVMELFCLGVGNYTERDIQELARCLTGSELRGGRFHFNKYQHDAGKKTVLERTGNFSGKQGIDIVLDQPAAPRFIARKLVRFFVCDEPEPTDALIEPLAAELRKNSCNIGPSVRRILTSNIFFSEAAIARKVRSPVALGVGLLRSLEGTTNLFRLAQDLDRLGQAVFYPPSVKGWDGGRTWINASTLLGRSNLVRRLVSGGATRFAGGGLSGLAARHASQEPDELVDWLTDLLLPVPISDQVRDPIVELAKKTGDSNDRVASTTHAICTLPEYQLC